MLRIIPFVFIFLLSTTAFAHLEKRSILLLHSYSPSYQWTQELQKGILQGLLNSPHEISVSIEHLDTHRRTTEEYFSTFAAYMQKKYEHDHFDGIIVTDDAAANFLSRIIDNFEADIPIIAIGINNHDLKLSQLSQQTHIIYSEDKILESLNLIGQLRPDIKTLYFLNDKTLSAQYVAEDVRRAFAISNLRDVELMEISDLTLDEAKKYLTKVSPQDAVLLSHFNTEIEEGHVHSYSEVSRSLGANSAAPIFVFWEFYIEHGITGGYVNHGEQLGRIAVYELDNFIHILNDKPDTVAPNYRPVFSFAALQRYGIALQRLPTESVVLDQPLTTWQRHWKVILIACAIILALTIIILLQWAVMRHRRTIAKSNQEIYRLQQQTLDTQKEMILLLGEAIETRSGETGNHVKRVAKVSAYLARLHGLSEAEVNTIEIVSPMHDVGKIAIPEAILEKPGKLTADEWEIMQSHTWAGHKLLSYSDAQLFQDAAIVALEHHERWDGNGYPKKKRGEDIHIYARITTIADVFDALLSKRCYKEAWPVDEVVAYFISKSGEQFDPHLTELLLRHIDDFVTIRKRYPDAT